MKKLFRVLVVDDKKPVLDAMRDWIESEYQIADEEFKIELLRLHVNVIKNNGQYEFTSQLFEELYSFCNKSFDLIFLDFGFVQQGVKALDELEKSKIEHPNKTVRELIDMIILNPSHIVAQSERYPKLYKKIKKYFIDYSNNLYIYTYLPSKIEQEYTSADVRKNITDKQFPKAKIKIIDTRKELFNNSKFDGKYDAEFYPFLISKFLSKIIKLEISEFLLNDTKEVRRKAKQIKKNDKIIALSIIVPSIIAGIFIPSLFSSIEKGEYAVAFAFLMMLVIIVFVLTVVPKILSRKI